MIKVLVAALTTLCVLAGQSELAAQIAVNPTAAADSFRLAPGDFLRINVWPDSSLGGRFQVESDGSVLLPAIGIVQLHGRPIRVVRNELRQRYSEALKQPLITLTPLFKVGVLGAVKQPGLYEVDPSITIYDIIAMAGGFNADANQRRVDLIRDGQSREIVADELADLGEIFLHSGDRVVVRQRRNRNVWPYLLQSATLILAIINFAR